MDEKTNALVDEILTEMMEKVCLGCAAPLLDSFGSATEGPQDKGPYKVCPTCAKIYDDGMLKLKQVKNNE